MAPLCSRLFCPSIHLARKLPRALHPNEVMVALGVGTKRLRHSLARRAAVEGQATQLVERVFEGKRPAVSQFRGVLPILYLMDSIFRVHHIYLANSYQLRLHAAHLRTTSYP